MKKGLLWQLTEYANKHRKKSRWQRIVTVMACVVVFCTTYALILPAITMEKTYECGKEEHTHTEECYTKVTTAARKEPACTLEQHNHTEQCYNESGEPICGYADFVVHTHNELCCDENGNLWCELPEIEGGTLDDNYYIVSEVQPVHEHTDECYALDENGNRTEELTCARTMVLEHQHTDECFRTVEESVDTEVLTCEIEEHTHTEECFLRDGLTEEEWTQIDGANALINALPARQEIEEKLTALEEAGDEEGYDALLTQLSQAATKAQAAYDALTEQQREKISDAGKLEDLAWLLTTLPDGGDTVSPVLDGDYAYINDLKILECKDGTDPFDSDSNPGNDASYSNKVLRTFDLATYTLQFTTALRPNANQAGYAEGDVYFRFVLPVSSKQAEFDLSGMSWIKTVKNFDKEYTEEGGQQILSGHYTLTPSGGNPAAIGAGFSQITVAIRVLDMKNGDAFTPQFSLWLDHNGENDHKKVDDTLTVSAASQYNVELVRPHSANTVTGSYDFSQGDSSAPNKNMGTVKGYLMGFGLTLQLRSDRNRGLLGMELPDENTEIAFDLDLSSVYTANGAEKNRDGDYRLLLWSSGSNSSGDAQGRTTNALHTAIVNAPYNQYQNPDGSYEYNSCNNGGTWKFEQNENSIRVTVTGFKLDASRFPYGTSVQSDTIYKYYTPGQDWSNVTAAVFSAGELWLLQPVENLSTHDAIEKVYDGAGQFTIKVEEKNLTVGNISTTQTKTDDDTASLGYRLGGGGTISVDLTHNQYQNTNYDGSLITGSHMDDSDWAAMGQHVTLRAQLSQGNAAGGGKLTAADLLVKFDGDFFEPDKTTEDRKLATSTAPVYVPSSVARPVLSYYWATKKDGSNWTSDAEMKRATEDDLVYYETLADVPGGYIPVALLLEVRGSINVENQSFPVCINGKVSETSQPGQVYMMTQSTLVWTRNDVANALEKTVDEMTDEECSNYVKNTLPSRNPHTQGNKLQLVNEGLEWNPDSAYVEPAVRQDYHTTGELTFCEKASYDTEGYHPGLYARNFQDSCLVVPYKTTITKSTAQKDNDSEGGIESKKVYGISANQRVVDFVLQPQIQGYLAVGEAAGVTKTVTVTVRDILPEELLYLNNTAYLGGTYQQDPNCEKPGTVTGGQALEPVMTTENGKTVLTWTFSTTVDLQAEHPNLLGPIYFSCLINEDKVSGNNDSFANEATAITSGEQFRGYYTKYGNLANFGITVNRTAGASITKLADQHNTDWWEPVGFLMNAGNNSANALTDTLITDTLPATGKNDGTVYDGSLVVAELLLGAKDDTNASLLMKNFQFYYTTNPAYAGLTGADLQNKLNKSSGKTWQQYLAADTTNWHELTAPTGFTKQEDEWYGGAASGLPSEENQQNTPITAIVAAGTLPANQTLKMHITVKLPEGKANDNLVNYLSMSVGEVNLRTFATTRLVSRSLSGLAWMDINADGIRDENETLLSGVKVNLLKLKDGAADLTDINSYEPFHYGNNPANEAVSVVTGQSVSAQNKNKVSTLEEGNYKFTDLPSGSYAVQFTSDAGTKIDFLTASLENQGNDDTVDSDGVPAYDTNDKLLYTLISNIDLRDQGGKPDSPHNDSGFYRNGPELPKTGGWGQGPYTIGGLLIICIGCFLLYSKNKRRAG